MSTSTRPRRTPPTRGSLAFAAAIILLLVTAGCGSANGTNAGRVAPGTPAVAPALTGSITVSAAASLSDVFAILRDRFLATHPDSQIELNFGSSSQLGSQIESGAPADVAAFADEATMTKLADQSLLDRPSEIFATNWLVIVTRPGNPKDIQSLADLTTAGTVSLCVESAPCGRYASQMLTAAGVSIPESTVTRGQDVKTTLGAVTEGDADVGIVYVTDARAAGSRVSTTEIPESQNVEARYPIGLVRRLTRSALAEAFVAYVLGADGQTALRDAGFGPP